MESLKKQAARILREQKRYKVWLAAFLCLALVVTAGTVATLTMSGQALNRKEKVLTCKETGPVAHTHNDDCYNGGQLVCTLPEVAAHVHGDECYTEQKTLVCAMEESAGHQHDEGCYATNRVQGELTCTIPEGHVHGDGCYTEGEEHTLTCTIPEGHAHGDGCYAWTEEKVLTCTIAEGEGAHTHTDECYVTEKVLACGQEELPVHVHGEGCFEEVIVEAGDESEAINGESGEPGDGEASEEIEEEAEEEEDTEAQTFQKIYEDAEIRVTAEYTEEANIPEGARLVAERISADVQAAEEGAETVEPEADAPGEDAEEAVGLETVIEEVTYKLRFLADGAEIAPEGTVTFTAQLLDEEGNAAGEPAVLTYNPGDGLDAMVVTLVKETVAEVQHEFSQVAENGNVRVTVEYGPEANIGDAKLQVKHITAETDSEHYASREAELQATLGNEDVVIDTLLNLGFYLNGAEVEPDAPVTVSIQFLDGEGLAVGEAVTVVHFAEKGTEVLNGSEVDAAGTTTFQMESFSEIVLLGTDVAIPVELSDGTFKVFGYVSDGTSWILVNEGGTEVPYSTIRVSNQNRGCVAVEAFAGIFGEYGYDYTQITNSNYNSCYWLGHDATEKTNIWADVAVTKQGDQYYWPFLKNPTSGSNLYVYYLNKNSSSVSFSVSSTDQIKNFMNSRYKASNASIVKFYVNKESEVADTAGNLSKPDAENFTSAVFETSTVAEYEEDYSRPLVYKEANDKGNQKVSVVLVAEDGNSTSRGDEEIRKLSSPEGVEVVNANGDKWTYRVADFPTDESVLAKLRSGTYGTVKVDGKEVASEELTTDNFTVRWYVFKYNNSDSWHIDGVLVRKLGKLTVTKTFYGDEAAISAVANKFNITVTEDGKTEPSYTLALKDKTADSKGGYDYREEKDGDVTYTWVLGVTANKKFVLKENDYTYTEGDIATLAEYRISNKVTSSSGTGTTTGNWQSYPAAGVQAEVESYAADLEYTSYQTVHFRNSYLPKNAITIWKYDQDSNGSLSGVAFELKRDGEVVTVYKAAGNNYYLYQPTEVEATETAELLVDSTGHLVLHGVESRFAGVYTLTETKHPDGYQAEEVKFTIADDGSVSMPQNSAATLVQADTGKNAYLLNVPNRSGTMALTIRKEWVGVAEGNQQEVEVQLWQGDIPTAHTVKLNADCNWQETITGLPKYVNGEEANYHLRETKIGGTVYSADADEDGYQFYDVSYQPLKDDVLIVRNAMEGGSFTFTKTDAEGAPLGGAVFGLYSDPDCSGEAVATATSGRNGEVKFIGLTDSIYYMKETGAPTGYKASEQIYKVTFANKVGTIEEYPSGSEGQESQEGQETAESGNPVTSIKNELAKQTIKIVKEDTNGQRLNGARFTLVSKSLIVNGSFVPDSNGYTSANVENEDGVVVDELELPYGTYELTETQAPENYFATQSITITVDVDGVTAAGVDGEFKLEAGEATEGKPRVWTLTVKNKLGWLDGTTLKKVSDQNNVTLLGEAKFILGKTEGNDTVYALIEEGVITDWVTEGNATGITTSSTGDDLGTAGLPKLEKGTYFLKELEAPDGYNLLNHSVWFEVKEMNGALELAAPTGASDGNIKIDGKDIIITNSMGVVLPETGGPGTVMYTLGGLAVIATSLVYGLSMRRKKRKGGCH